MDAYRENIEAVTAKTMFEKDGEVDEQFIQANLCWLVTDNMEALLAKGKPTQSKGAYTKVFKFIKDSLHENKLVIVSQDVGTAYDHHFAAIGMKGMILVVEHLQDRCNAIEVYEPDEFAKKYSDIFSGKAPDTFYGIASKKVISALAFNRKTMSAEVVLNYIAESKKPRKINIKFKGKPISEHRATFEESIVEGPKIPKSLRKEYAEYIRLVEAYEGKKIDPNDPVHIAIFMDPADRQFTMQSLREVVESKPKVSYQLPQIPVSRVPAPVAKPKYSKDYLDFVALHEKAYEHETDPDDEYFQKIYADPVERKYHIAQATDLIKFREAEQAQIAKEEAKEAKAKKESKKVKKPQAEEDLFSLSFTEEPSSSSESKKSRSTRSKPGPASRLDVSKGTANKRGVIDLSGRGMQRRGLMFR
jgi:hypothetical protein